MSDYTNAELLNEVSKIFRASLSPGKDGGTLNTATEYRQLLEMASATFLFNPDAVFYIARLAANRLNITVLQEVAVLEDLLVSLDDLSQIGAPVRDTTSLNNARTAVLSLDAASSVTDRPETQRFVRQIDAYTTLLRENLISKEKAGKFVRPREEAKDLIQTNLATLTSLHDSLLEQVFTLRGLLQDFLSLDLPSKVSATVLTTISSRLEDDINTVSTTTDVANLAVNRQLFLASLANKVSVKVLSSITDPTEYKYRSPTRPIPAGLTHLGYVTGQGTPASVLTGAGPWTLPISAPLVLSVNGGAPVSLSLDTIVGSVLNARNREAYNTTAAARHLHVVVDPEVQTGTVSSSLVGKVTLNEYLNLGFKHLGATVQFPDIALTDPTDIYLRFISELRPLQGAVAPNITFVDPLLTVSLFSAIDEGAIGFQPGHVGAYVKDAAGNRFEVLQVNSTSQCVLDTRGVTPTFTSLTLCGQYSTGLGSTVFDFLPVVTTAPTASQRVAVGPSIKTAQLPLGAITAANVITAIEAELGLYPSNQEGAKLNWHVKPELVAGDPTRVALKTRSKKDPLIQVSGRFLVQSNSAVAPAIDVASAHRVLGFHDGELDTTSLLTPSELSAAVGALTGMAAAVVTTEVLEGTLETTALGTTIADLAGQDLYAAGVRVGDQIEIPSGISAGTYRVVGVPTTSTLTLDRTPFDSKETGLVYRVFREQVIIYVTDAGPSTSLTVVSAPTELDLLPGTVYSSLLTFEAVDKLGNKLDFANAVAGDLLRVVGQSEVSISAVQGTTLTLETGLPSNTLGVGFEVRSLSAREYSELNAQLQTFTTSPSLLKKNRFDEGVEAIDNAVTTAVLPGQNFLASRNQAKRMVADLLSILTDQYLRTSEYSTLVTVNIDNLSSTLAGYSAVAVPSVDSLFEALLDRKYDRSADLLRSGQFTGFFNTTDETGSYSGAVLSASRAVVKDLPNASRTRIDFLNRRDLAVASSTVPDAEEDFSDVDNETTDIDL
jgi:hypothetical protein